MLKGHSVEPQRRTKDEKEGEIRLARSKPSYPLNGLLKLASGLTASAHAFDSQHCETEAGGSL